MLQGTFDIFSFTELVAMLATGSKTGTLEVTSGGARAHLHFRDGLCCGVDPAPSPIGGDDDLNRALVDVCFDLAREADGEFGFRTEEPPASDHLVDVEPALARVEALLAEWGEVRSRVPSLELFPRLAPALAGESITLSAAEWAFAVALDGYTSVRDLAGTGPQALLATCQAVAALVERGAVHLHEQRVAAGETGRRAVYEAPAVVPVEPYGPGVDSPAGAVVEGDEALPAASVVDVPVGGAEQVPTDGSEEVAAGGSEEIPADGVEEVPADGVEEVPADGVEDVKDRGALLRMFSALRDA